MARIIKSAAAMSEFSASLRKKGKTIGFVPTMGALHEGHLSLIKEAKKRNDAVIVSIFVNPTQFGPKEDLKKYPRVLRKDMKLLSKFDVDAVFHPSVREIYPDGFSTYIEVEGLSDKLCGASRPGHFRGVATVVAKLFNIVKPDSAYFGEKDFQQLAIIKKMVRDLNLGMKIIPMPIIREMDGLAMSSRNSYLTREEREKAPAINKALEFAKMLALEGVKNARTIKAAISKLINTEKGIRIDYVSICDPETLDEKKTVKGKTLIAIGAYIGKTRLIDNIVIK
jgi:pantoate--beta-alanine ligase